MIKIFENISFFAKDRQHLEEQRKLITECIFNLPQHQTQVFCTNYIDLYKPINIPVLPIKIAKLCTGTFIVDDFFMFNLVRRFTNYSKILFLMKQEYWSKLNYVNYEQLKEIFCSAKTHYIVNSVISQKTFTNAWGHSPICIERELDYEKISHLLF